MQGQQTPIRFQDLRTLLRAREIVIQLDNDRLDAAIEVARAALAARSSRRQYMHEILPACVAYTIPYKAETFLVECAGGPLPGGNAMDWNWADARQLPADRPVILAGGLAPDNFAVAIAGGGPAAVDVSSGVEISPGRKDMAKVTAFCRAVAACGATTPFKIFD